MFLRPPTKKKTSYFSWTFCWRIWETNSFGIIDPKGSDKFYPYPLDRTLILGDHIGFFCWQSLWMTRCLEKENSTDKPNSEFTLALLYGELVIFRLGLTTEIVLNHSKFGIQEKEKSKWVKFKVKWVRKTHWKWKIYLL